MAIPAGRTLFKKKDGILTLTPDQQTVTWTPNTGGPPTVSLPVERITNLQQTPDSAAKVMLRIFEKAATDGAEPVTYLFHFNTSEAKAEALAVKELLSRLLADVRSKDPGVPRPTGTPGGGSTPSMAAGSSVSNGKTATDGAGSVSGSMAFASAANPQGSSARWFDDAQLRNDIELQQSLMRKDTSLHQTYVEAMSTKPESLSSAAFNSQFWSTRTSLLRAHAIETNQKKGAYNVLSTVKPRTVDGELKLNISVEQVLMIFSQHPLVKRIYNENVPRPLSESQFWSRFFLSRLSKKLRGERVAENSDAPDALFDKYDASENTHGFQSKIMAQSVPHVIDLEANEENQGGFRSGNAKDVEMRPRANIPIVKTLNSLSEKIMANVAPSDVILDAGANEVDTLGELALRDLRGEAKEHRIMLNVTEQNKFFSKRDAAPSSNAKIFAGQNVDDVLFDIQGDLDTLEDDGGAGIDLHAGIGFNPDSESEEEDEDDKKATSSAKHAHVGSRSAIRAAEKDIMSHVLQQRSQSDGSILSTSNSDDANKSGPMGLPTQIADKCALTHATTIEFLHQFWAAFLSGDPDRATELQYLSQSLSNSRERIEAVAQEAEREREDVIRRRKQEIRDIYQRTGKKIRWKPHMVGGGREAVEKLMKPALDAIGRARADYERALAAEGMQASTEG